VVWSQFKLVDIVNSLPQLSSTGSIAVSQLEIAIVHSGEAQIGAINTNLVSRSRVLDDIELIVPFPVLALANPNVIPCPTGRIGVSRDFASHLGTIAQGKLVASGALHTPPAFSCRFLPCISVLPVESKLKAVVGIGGPISLPGWRRYWWRNWCGDCNSASWHTVVCVGSVTFTSSAAWYGLKFVTLMTNQVALAI